jgi:hypothetical protein
MGSTAAMAALPVMTFERALTPSATVASYVPRTNFKNQPRDTK